MKIGTEHGDAAATAAKADGGDADSRLMIDPQSNMRS